MLEPIPAAYGKGRVHPWMSRLLISWPYVNIMGFTTLLMGVSTVLWRSPGPSPVPPHLLTFVPNCGFNQQPSTAQSSSLQTVLPAAQNSFFSLNNWSICAKHCAAQSAWSSAVKRVRHFIVVREASQGKCCARTQRGDLLCVSLEEERCFNGWTSSRTGNKAARSLQLLPQLLRTDNRCCYLPLPLMLKTLSTAVQLSPSDAA